MVEGIVCIKKKTTEIIFLSILSFEHIYFCKSLTLNLIDVVVHSWLSFAWIVASQYF